MVWACNFEIFHCFFCIECFPCEANERCDLNIEAIHSNLASNAIDVCVCVCVMNFDGLSFNTCLCPVGLTGHRDSTLCWFDDSKATGSSPLAQAQHKQFAVSVCDALAR